MKSKPVYAYPFLGIAAAIVSAFIAVPAQSGQNANYANPVEPKTTPQLNLGKLNFDAYCASCHGKTAAGSGKGPTFISRIYHPGHHGDQAFYIAAKRGARAHHWKFGDMKPVDGITDDQITAIINYVRAVQKANGLF